MRSAARSCFTFRVSAAACALALMSPTALAEGPWGAVKVQSVAYQRDGSFALVLKAQAASADMSLLLQPCRVQRVFGKLDGQSRASQPILGVNANPPTKAHPAVIAALMQARDRATPVVFGWDGAGFKSVSRAQPCVGRVAALRLVPGSQVQVMATAAVRPTPTLAAQP
jgi:hypothetical protein